MLLSFFVTVFPLSLPPSLPPSLAPTPPPPEQGRPSIADPAATGDATFSGATLPVPSSHAPAPESSASSAPCSSPPLSCSARAAAAAGNPISASLATFAPDAALAASRVA